MAVLDAGLFDIVDGLLDIVEGLDAIGAAAGAGLLMEGELIAPEFIEDLLPDPLIEEPLDPDPLIAEPLPLLIGLPVLAAGAAVVLGAGVAAAFALAAFAAARFCFAVIVDGSCEFIGVQLFPPVLAACA